MEETERKKIIRIKPGERKKQPAVDLGVAGGITPAEKDFKEKVAGRVQVKQDEINNLIYERIAKDQLPDNGGEDLFKKKRIEQLTKEIEELNKRVQQSYKMENYTVRKSGNVEPDVEKMVLEKEAEIRKLEKEIGGNEIDNPKPGEEQGTVPGGVQAIEKDEESVRDKEDNKATDEPQLPKPATVEAGQDNEAQAAENISKANSFDELRSEIERIGIINGSKENFSAADLNRIITTAELFFEKNPDQFTFTKEALLGSLVAITGTFGIRDKVIELVLKRHAELHENNEVIENEAVNSNRESAQEKDEEKKDWDGRYAKPEEIIDAEFKEVEPLRITDQNFRGENAEKLNQLENELDHLRKEYLEVDYKKNTGYKRLGKIFGRSFQNKESKLVENDQDIAWYRAHYDDKLMDYKSALLDDWKVKGSTPERLAEIAKIFETEANINMADGHTRTKVEHQEGRMGKGMVDLMDKTIRNYRNLSFKQKLAISAAFGIAGVGAGLTGSAFLIGGAATAATIRRFFLGTVTGTSAALSAESMTQRNREKSVEKNTAKLVKQFEGKAPKEIEELARERINGLIYDEDQKINTIKNKNLRNLGVGIGVGLASALAVPEFMKHGKEWISHAGIGEKIAGVFGYHHAGSVKLGGGILDHKNHPNLSHNPAGHAAGTHAGAPVHETPKVAPKALAGHEVSPSSRAPVGSVHAPEAPVNKVVPPYKITPEGVHQQPVPKITPPGAEHMQPEVKIPSGANAHEAAKNIVTIKQGGSIERILTDKGTSPGEAHRMVFRSATEKAKEAAAASGRSWNELSKAAKHRLIEGEMKKMNLVHAGDKIEISPDGKNFSLERIPKTEWPKAPIYHAAGHNIENDHSTGAQHAAETAKVPPVAEHVPKIHPNPVEFSEKLHPGGPPPHLPVKEVEALRHQPRPSAESIIKRLHETGSRPSAENVMRGFHSAHPLRPVDVRFIGKAGIVPGQNFNERGSHFLNYITNNKNHYRIWERIRHRPYHEIKGTEIGKRMKHIVDLNRRILGTGKIRIGHNDTPNKILAYITKNSIDHEMAFRNAA